MRVSPKRRGGSNMLWSHKRAVECTVRVVLSLGDGWGGGEGGGGGGGFEVEDHTI